jgi:Universal stress protein family
MNQERAYHASPAKALIRASRNSRMLVVGSRGLGGISEMVLGSVSDQCVRPAHCPVLVARRPKDLLAAGGNHRRLSPRRLFTSRPSLGCETPVRRGEGPVRPFVTTGGARGCTARQRSGRCGGL